VTVGNEHSPQTATRATLNTEPDHGFSDEELLKLWNTVPHETLKKLGKFDAARKPLSRAQESSQRRQLELEASLGP